MTRLFFIAIMLSALVAVGGLAPAAQAGETAADALPGDPPAIVTLRTNVTVYGDVIRLGDIFQGAQKYADRSVAYAPRPGTRAVFDARWLARIASGFKLDWRPQSSTDRTVVERASRVVTKDEIEDMLLERWRRSGGDANDRAMLSNRTFRLHLPVDGTGVSGPELTIEQMNVDPGSKRFVSIVTWGSASDERMRLTGEIQEMTEIPVLTDRVRRGEVIDESDIEWKTLTVDHVPNGALVEPQDIIGMATKRTLAQGRAVRQGDVQHPLLVNRGDTVTIILRTPTMQLTAKGRALENGSKGETIRISNLQTSTVVDAVVTGTGTTRVDTPLNLAMR